MGSDESFAKLKRGGIWNKNLVPTNLLDQIWEYFILSYILEPNIYRPIWKPKTNSSTITIKDKRLCFFEQETPMKRKEKKDTSPHGN